jgi:hypothetical protein
MLEHVGVRAPQSRLAMRHSDIIPEHACSDEPILRTNRRMFTSLGVPLAAPSCLSAGLRRGDCRAARDANRSFRLRLSKLGYQWCRPIENSPTSNTSPMWRLSIGCVLLLRYVLTFRLVYRVYSETPAFMKSDTPETNSKQQTLSANSRSSPESF